MSLESAVVEAGAPAGELRLLLPRDDVTAPEISIVVPALDEELTIGAFVEWCQEGLGAAGRPGEVLIVDSSSDATPRIALEKGARVLRTPRRGLGRAYIDAVPFVRGRYVIMGDCDLTYDFRELRPFVEALESGHDFVMGNRLRGAIEPGAMPALHRYFGTPVTTFALNLIYGTAYGDIHCGMRAMRLETLKRMDLRSQSWEYASEMVLKAARMGARIGEVPIRFYKDREGRLSHHKRSGWLSPWRAGWINLKSMFLFAPEFFLQKPGGVMLAAGLLLAGSLGGGPYRLFGVGVDLHLMLLGVTLATVGYGAVQSATLARVFYGFDPAYTERVARRVTYNRGSLAGLGLGVIGLLLNLSLLARWVGGELKLHELQYAAVFGLLLIILGFQTFTFTLLLHMILERRERG